MLDMVSMRSGMARSFDRRALDGLGVLQAVVSAGSFVGAGEILGLTQPAVSRAVATLERRLGIRLFHRTARSISLTEEGRRFAEVITPHLRAIEEATAEAGTTGEKVRGRLRVNVDEGLAQFVLAPYLGTFLDRYPELSLELVARGRVGELVRAGFDVAVHFGPPQLSSLKARLLLKSRVITCASPDYLRRHGTPRQPLDLESHRCILVRDPSTSGPFAWELVRGATTVPVRVKGQLMVSGGSALFAACIAGQGVAQVFELYAREALASGALVHVLPAWSDERYPLYAYHHAGPLKSAKVQAFLDLLSTIGNG
jgi:DNA-binding transcriptional LysR family regulator